MSSILDALSKVEAAQRAGRGEVTPPVPPPRRRPPRWSLGVALALGVAVTAVLLKRREQAPAPTTVDAPIRDEGPSTTLPPPAPPTAVPTVPTAAPPPQAVPALPAPVLNERPQARVEVPTPPATVPPAAPQLAATPPPTYVEPTAVAPGPPQTVVAARPPAVPAPPAEAEPAPTPPPLEASPPSPEPAPEAPRAANPARPGPLPRVRVSLLAYSHAAERRSVSLSIEGGPLVSLKEGEEANDIAVVRILPDRVDLRRGGITFTVQPRD